ncbi:hypothetical protein RJ639_019424 [Escallonia herrerae]|uniref:NADH dehydrogenase [ubiquinone] iron-sulfur protein 5 n=1 Tax=Escallonia herrerae TaxID=1293975 RepID=A0AA88V8P5_9ASTE|nr:hypothetical protein RJ639_019424 [Escallonia herrerae]
MASGWGITGNKGRCYDFWMDFSECMSRCREPKDCSLLREDYLECLHHAKEWRIGPNWAELLSQVGLLLLPIILLLVMQFHSSDQGSFASSIFSTREPDTIHRASASPIGVAFFLVLILLLFNRVFIFGGDNDSGFQRRNRVYKEEQRQIRAAAQKAKGKGGDGDHHH